jgi:hypothetical protein
MANIIKHETGNQHFWEKHLTQWRESGSSQAEYCRNNKLKEHTFSYHKCKHTKKNAPINNAQTGFIKVLMPANKIEPEQVNGFIFMREYGSFGRNIMISQDSDTLAKELKRYKFRCR